MQENKPTMTKLASGGPLSAFLLSNTQTLWHAGDHLLLHSTTGYSERVRRFYFADLQSIVYARSNTGTVVTVLCAAAAAALLFFGFWSMSGLGTAGGLVIAALSLIPLGGLVFNVLAGPTCTCVFSTAVQSERVTALNRIPKTERVIGQILPLIDAAQGRLSADMLGDDAVVIKPVEAARHVVVEGTAGRPALRHDFGRLHRTVYLLCLILAASHAVDLFVVNGVKDALDAFLFAALVICTLVAFRRQRDSDLPVSVKSLSPVILACLAGYFICSSALGGILFMVDPDRILAGGARTMLPRESLATQVYLVAATIGFSLLGMVGLMRLGGVARRRTDTGMEAVEPSAAGEEPR